MRIVVITLLCFCLMGCVSYQERMKYEIELAQAKNTYYWRYKAVLVGVETEEAFRELRENKIEEALRKK